MQYVSDLFNFQVTLKLPLWRSNNQIPSEITYYHNDVVVLKHSVNISYLLWCHILPPDYLHHSRTSPSYQPLATSCVSRIIQNDWVNPASPLPILPSSLQDTWLLSEVPHHPSPYYLHHSTTPPSYQPIVDWQPIQFPLEANWISELNTYAYLESLSLSSGDGCRANDFPRSRKTDGIRGIYPVKRNCIFQSSNGSVTEESKSTYFTPFGNAHVCLRTTLTFKALIICLINHREQFFFNLKSS